MTGNLRESIPQSHRVLVDGLNLHYLEAGQGGPPILLLHGVPTHAYLWRNVIPRLALHARTVALDLVGFGSSDKPEDLDYDIATQARFVAGAIDALGLARAVIVGMDIGLLAGVQFAVEHPSRVSGLVMLEGLVLPMERAWRDLPLGVRVRLRLLRNPRLAEQMVVRSTRFIEQALARGTDRALARSEVQAYLEPFADPEVRRRVLLRGAGPVSLRPNSARPGGLAEAVDRCAEKLRASALPKLLLHARPGMMVRKGAVAQARKTLPNLEVQAVGTGRHFLPEDEPGAIAAAIVAFHRRVGASRPDGAQSAG